MKKIIATVAATGLLLIGGASAASAETLYRSGANKVTITAQGAPAGAQVIKARVTVKKGSKTVAKNKAFYKASKGKYRVISTVTYLPMVTRPMTAADADSPYCLITSRAVVSHQTTWVAYDYDPAEGRVTGPARIRYTGTCTVEFYPTEAYGGSQTRTYNTAWTEDVTVFGIFIPRVHDRNSVILEEEGTPVNSWTYASDSGLESYPTLTFATSPWELTTKTTRTVVVR